MSVSEAAAGGSRRTALLALRDSLAASVDAVEDRYKAALAKQLADVLRELDSLPAAKETTPVDDLNARRTARRKAAGQ